MRDEVGFANCLKLLHLIIARPVKQLRKSPSPVPLIFVSRLCQGSCCPVPPTAVSEAPPAVLPVGAKFCRTLRTRPRDSTALMSLRSDGIWP